MYQSIVNGITHRAQVQFCNQRNAVYSSEACYPHTIRNIILKKFSSYIWQLQNTNQRCKTEICNFNCTQFSMGKIFHCVRVHGQIMNFSQTYKTLFISPGVLHASIFKEVLKILQTLAWKYLWTLHLVTYTFVTYPRVKILSMLTSYL
jgi:hypothetical protein